MSDKAGWEVEGFISQLIKRDDTNSERLVLAAISHLRAFSRDCDALRDSTRKAADEIERLRAALRDIAERPEGSLKAGDVARAALNGEKE